MRWNRRMNLQNKRRSSSWVKKKYISHKTRHPDKAQSTILIFFFFFFYNILIAFLIVFFLKDLEKIKHLLQNSLYRDSHTDSKAWEQANLKLHGSTFVKKEKKNKANESLDNNKKFKTAAWAYHYKDEKVTTASASTYYQSIIKFKTAAAWTYYQNYYKAENSCSFDLLTGSLAYYHFHSKTLRAISGQKYLTCDWCHFEI